MLKVVKVSAFLLVTSLSLVKCEDPQFTFLPSYGMMKQEELIKEIETLKEKIAFLEKKESFVLSKTDELKLKFLLKQVISYK